MKINSIKTENGKIIEDITATCDKSDYEVLCRMWVRSDGAFIREWTPNEYLTINPHNNIILSVKIDKQNIDVEAHCLELRNVYARNRNGNRVISFLRHVDYGEYQNRMEQYYVEGNYDNKEYK